MPRRLTQRVVLMDFACDHRSTRRSQHPHTNSPYPSRKNGQRRRRSPSLIGLYFGDPRGLLASSVLAENPCNRRDGPNYIDGSSAANGRHCGAPSGTPKAEIQTETVLAHRRHRPALRGVVQLLSCEADPHPYVHITPACG